MKSFRVILTAIAAALSLAPMAYAQVANPVAGYDYSGLRFHPVNVDSQGRLQVVGSAAGGSVYGNNAAGTAPSQPPVLIGGWDASNVRTLKTDTNGNLTVGGAYVTGSTAATVSGLMVGGSDGTNYRHLKTDTTGALFVSSQANLTTVGNINAGATDSGAPVKVGGVYNSTLPTYTAGQRGDLQVAANGLLGVMTTTYDGTAGSDAQTSLAGTLTRISTGLNASQGPVPVANGNYYFNGSSWDRMRSIAGATSNASLAVTNAPSSSVNAAIPPVVSSALESGHVLKASAGNLYRIAVTTTVSGYLMVFNSTTVPADGAVTPQMCRQVGAGSSEVDHAEIPQRYSTGISVAFSTTGCFTKTASAQAMFEGDVQ